MIASFDCRFLDKAAIVQWDSKSGNPCTVTQVEETKILVRMIPIFACTIIMSTCLAQLQTISVEQGFAMNRKLGKVKIPPSSLPIIPFVFMLIATPVYERLFVPFARRFTGLETGITYLQRVGVGLVLSIISMSIAAVVEAHRKQYAKHHYQMSMFYLSFQYFVFGIADLFTLVGLLDFFYSQSPGGMKSLSTCFTWVSLSLGYFLSSVLVKIVNAATQNNTKSRGWVRGFNIDETHVDLFYALLAVLSTINFFIYLLCAKFYQYRPPAKDQNHEDNFVGKRFDTPYHKSSSQISMKGTPQDSSSQSMNSTPHDSYKLEHSGQLKSNEFPYSSPQQSIEFENSRAQDSSGVTTPVKVKMDSVSQEKTEEKNSVQM
ncbi:protein NRT1/ PTR FAMILY 4.6-like [Cryptomeria japonica]|uniref:protein NRT1/ PTR FAMILY 4.6-like n=1 Tax=Cryptomeria japonica TaxID=3369 RepID=UPI0027DAA96F|nr:protein NRT1/ PTR FAMILY 4.6-like [Cryptomeria japonica]